MSIETGSSRRSTRLGRMFRRSRFTRDARGVSAVEFALAAPLIFLILFGEFTFCDALSAKRKLTIASHTVADLVARQVSVSSSRLSDIMNATAQIAAPYQLSKMVIVVSEVTTDVSGNTTVTWSNSLHGTPLTAGRAFTLPTGLGQPGTSLIYAHLTYSYTPLLGHSLFGTLNLSSDFYMSPRMIASVAYTN